MIATRTSTLYLEVVQITQDFLGPASERFVTRQIKTHINKEPSELTHEDLVKLAEWLKVSIALLTEDDKMVSSYTENILKLAENKARR